MKKFLIALLASLVLTSFSCATGQSTVQTQQPPFPTPVVLLYTAEGCWWCEKAEKFLKDNSIEYVERDLEDPEQFKKLQEIAEKLNYKGGLRVVPLFVVGKYIVRGFDPIEVMYSLEKSKWSEPGWNSIL